MLLPSKSKGTKEIGRWGSMVFLRALITRFSLPNDEPEVIEILTTSSI
jgi:hypothetical protein